MAKKKIHVHKFILRNIGRNKDYWVYACTLNGCDYYRPAELLEGKPTICWVCGKECIVPKGRPDGRRIKRPHCISCTKEYIRQLPKPSSMPVDLKKLEEMSIEDLLGDDDLFNPDKKEEH